jgi:cell division protease FtsH
MVCDWGMSDLGPVTYGDNQDHIFLGREISRTQNYSEDTARKIDEAITTINSDQYQRAESFLKEHRDALILVAESLLEHETLEGRHVEEILEFGQIRSPVVASAPRPISEAGEEAEPRKARKETKEGDGDLAPAGAPA